MEWAVYFICCCMDTLPMKPSHSHRSSITSRIANWRFEKILMIWPKIFSGKHYNLMSINASIIWARIPYSRKLIGTKLIENRHKLCRSRKSRVMECVRQQESVTKTILKRTTQTKKWMIGIMLVKCEPKLYLSLSLILYCIIHIYCFFYWTITILGPFGYTFTFASITITFEL